MKDKNDENLDINNLSISDEENQESESLKNTEKENIFIKKKKPIKKILLVILSLVLLLIIILLTLYFLGYFDKTEEKPISKEKVTLNTPQMNKSEKKYKFDIKDINSKKLNQELRLLTKRNIHQEEIEEKEKLEDENKIKEKNLKNQEEELKTQKLLLEKKKEDLELEKLELEKLKQEAISLKNEMINNKKILEKEQVDNSKDKFLMLINVVRIKGNLYKYYLDKISSINPNVLLCRDIRNNIEIYYGPFKNTKKREDLFNTLLKNNFKQAYTLELSVDEFNKRCNY